MLPSRPREGMRNGQEASVRVKKKKTTMIITVTTIMIIFKISWSSEKAPLDHLFCSRVSFWSYM